MSLFYSCSHVWGSGKMTFLDEPPGDASIIPTYLQAKTILEKNGFSDVTNGGGLKDMPPR